jgi:hypothetical protein
LSIVVLIEIDLVVDIYSDRFARLVVRSCCAIFSGIK